MTTPRTNSRTAAKRRAQLIDNTATRISSAARQIGTSGQVEQIAALPPVTAAFVAVECFRARMAMDDGFTAHTFRGNLRDCVVNDDAPGLEAPSARPDRTPVTEAAAALLRCIDTITTDDFSRGAERIERETLRDALISAGYSEFVR